MFKTVGSGVLWASGTSTPLGPDGAGLGFARRPAGNATAGKLRFGLALMVTAVGSRGVATVAPAPAIAESTFIALVGAEELVDAIPDVAGSLTRLWEETLGGATLIRGTRLVETAALPELPPAWPIVLPMLVPTDPGVGLTVDIGAAEGEADPVGTAADALAVDAVALPGVDAVAPPVIAVALAEIGAVDDALSGGSKTCAAVAVVMD
jgi:hypothetical protein